MKKAHKTKRAAPKKKTGAGPRKKSPRRKRIMRHSKEG
jgi:hypothetical protein